MKSYLPLLLPLCCSPLMAEVPFVFESGTAARASEVNANFSDLDAGVEDNRSRISSLESGGGVGGCAPLNDFTESFHNISFNQQTSSVGDLLTIGGTDYRVVLIGFQEFGSGDTYSIQYPIQESGSPSFVAVNAGHVTGEVRCQNDTISGFPALSQVSVSQNYLLNNNSSVANIPTAALPESDVASSEDLLIALALGADLPSSDGFMPISEPDVDLDEILRALFFGGPEALEGFMPISDVEGGFVAGPQFTLPQLTLPSSVSLTASGRTSIVVGQTVINLFITVNGSSSSSVIASDDFDFTDNLTIDSSEGVDLVQTIDDLIDHIVITRLTP